MDDGFLEMTVARSVAELEPGRDFEFAAVQSIDFRLSLWTVLPSDLLSFLRVYYYYLRRRMLVLSSKL